MALLAESKNFSSPDEDDTQNESLNASHWGSEAPKVHLCVAGTNGSATTISNHIKNSIGWATNTDDYAMGTSSHNGQGTSVCNRVYSDQYCYFPLNFNGGTYERAEQSSYGAASVGHTWDQSANDGYYYWLMALGGSHIEDVSIDVIDTATSAGDVSYTGPGFQPTCLIAIWNYSTDTGSANKKVSSISAMGFSDGSTDACAIGVSRDAQTTSDTSSVLCSDFVRVYDAATLSTQDSCTVKSLDATGYTLTWSSADATARKVVVVAIKGPGAKVVKSLQPTTNTTVDIDIGVVPKAGICMGAMKTASESASAHNRMFVGSWDSMDNMDSVGWMDEDGQATTDVDRYISAVHSIKNYNHARSVVGRAEVAVQGNGIRETWSNTDGTEYQHAWLLLSEDAPPSPPSDDADDADGGGGSSSSIVPVTNALLRPSLVGV